MPQFDGPRMKIMWARNHIKNIDNMLREFLKTNPFRVFAIPNGVAMEMARELPNEVPLLIGDAVHNLRTALDLLACELVRLNNKSTHRVYFPFANSGAEIDEQIKNKNFRRAGKDAVTLLKTFAPYTGGNALLRGIHDLDILDKHQLIVPVFNTAMVRHMTIIADDAELEFNDTQLIGRILSFGMPPNARVKPGAVVESFPVFGAAAPKPFADALVIKSLEDGAQLVLEIIEAFEALRVGRPPPAMP